MNMERELALFLSFLEQEKGIVIDSTLAEEFSRWSSLESTAVQTLLFQKRISIGWDEGDCSYVCGHA